MAAAGRPDREWWFRNRSRCRRVVVGRHESSVPLNDLTEREREVLTLLAEGRSNQAIGDRLCSHPRPSRPLDDPPTPPEDLAELHRGELKFGRYRLEYLPGCRPLMSTPFRSTCRSHGRSNGPLAVCSETSSRCSSSRVWRPVTRTRRSTMRFRWAMPRTWWKTRREVPSVRSSGWNGETFSSCRSTWQGPKQSAD